MLAYHNPFIACADLPVDSLAGLPVIGVKDSSGSPDRLLDELARYPGDIYAGVGRLTWPWPARWARPVPCWPLANLAPEACIAPGTGTPQPSATWPRSTWPSARAARRS